MIEILTSGVALGVHVPGLLLADRLRERGVDVTVSVLERMLPDRVLSTTGGMKWAFHRDFRFALAGQRIARTVPVPGDALAATVAAWHARKAHRFVVFSGFWLPVLERYATECADPPEIDVCHVDSVPSPSFRKTGPTTLATRAVWLADAENTTLPCSIPVTREPPLPWADREHRLLVHGGGWGMGTYRETATELRAHGFALDVVAYERRDVTGDDPGVRHFMLDPEWHPWLDDGYPPFGEVTDPGSAPHYTRGVGHHGSFDLTRTAIATVSKPGGGTLLDALWSATPTVLLAPFGEHERRNAELWQRLGFGIAFPRWRDSGFDLDLLRDPHDALARARQAVPDYSALLTSAPGTG